ncbi:MAG: hypothetical protein AAGU27_28830, partial [Dehalobacterium sp.]
MPNLIQKFLDKGRKRKLSGIQKQVFRWTAIILSLYLIYGNIFESPYMIVFRGVFLTGILTLIFLLYTAPGQKSDKLTVVEYGAIFLSIALAVYILIDQERLITRHAFFDPVMPLDYV